MMMAASLKMATLLPELAIRPNRPALFLNEVDMFEKTSFYRSRNHQAISQRQSLF